MLDSSSIEFSVLTRGGTIHPRERILNVQGN